MEQSIKPREYVALKVLCVVLGLSLLLWIVLSNSFVDGALPRSREAVLKQDLSEIRKAIANYKLEYGYPPPSLNDLVRKFLLNLPVDPITNNGDWIVQFEEMEMSKKERIKGVVDVHSDSNKTSSEGDRYNTW